MRGAVLDEDDDMSNGLKQAGDECLKGNAAGGGLRPEGLEGIYNTCLKLYPDQPNPLQVTALVKYW